jgi:hypothetical protein
MVNVQRISAAIDGQYGETEGGADSKQAVLCSGTANKNGGRQQQRAINENKEKENRKKGETRVERGNWIGRSSGEG